MNKTSKEERLKLSKELLDNGVLSEIEYEKRKKEILNSKDDKKSGWIVFIPVILLVIFLAVMIFTPDGSITNSSNYSQSNSKISEDELNNKIDYNSLNSKITIDVLDKIDYEADWIDGLYSPFSEFKMKYTNNTDKDIRGFQGEIIIIDMFDSQMMSLMISHTEKVIPANSSIMIDGVGLDVNEFIDRDVKVYNTKFENLKFEYEITDIVYRN